MKWLVGFLVKFFAMRKIMAKNFGLPLDEKGNVDATKILKAYCLQFNNQNCMIAILLETGWEYFPYSEALNGLLLEIIPKKYETFTLTPGAMNLLVNQNLVLELSADPLADPEIIRKKYGIS